MTRKDQYSLVLLRKGRVFRVFTPTTRQRAQNARRKVLRHWKHESFGDSAELYDAKVIQCADLERIE